MKLVTFGDSITRGSFCDESGWQVADPNFSKVAAAYLHVDEFTCLGTNGVSYCSRSPVNPDAALSKTCGDVTGDIIVIAGGTNDYGSNVPLGNQTDDTDISFYGAVDCVLRKLRENNPNKIIIAVTPIKRINEDQPNKAGAILEDYRAAIIAKAEKYSAAVVNGEKIFPNAYDKNIYPDGLHPNNTGHRLYGEYLGKEIKTILHRKGAEI